MSSVVDTTPETIDETWLEEVPCEYGHRISTCSTEVTHRLANCLKQSNVCAVAADISMRKLEEGRHLACADCLCMISACWDIRLI